MKIILTKKLTKENYALKKDITAFDCIHKILNVLSAASGGICIISSVSVVGAPVGIAEQVLL